MWKLSFWEKANAPQIHITIGLSFGSFSLANAHFPRDYRPNHFEISFLLTLSTFFVTFVIKSLRTHCGNCQHVNFHGVYGLGMGKSEEKSLCRSVNGLV